MQGVTSYLQLATPLLVQRSRSCRSRQAFSSGPSAANSRRQTARIVAAGQQQAQTVLADSRQCAAAPRQCQAPSTAERLLLLAPAALGCLAAVAALPLLSLPAAALGLHAEPQNALSLPTWAIHVSSVIEWTAAMALVWRYADVSGEPRWKGLTWGMMPLLAGALCACTHHFFYNSPDLDVLVALQAGFTVLGNATCWAAAWRIYAASKTEAEA